MEVSAQLLGVALGIYSKSLVPDCSGHVAWTIFKAQLLEMLKDYCFRAPGQASTSSHLFIFLQRTSDVFIQYSGFEHTFLLKMEAISSPETSANFYWTKRRLVSTL
jgi:hypothetical protein